MTVPVTVTGMVLTAMPVGDYDKRLVILTRERGKITAFARGARRQTSALLACAQPFSFGEFSLYESRTAYNVSSASVSNYFVELREDLEAVTYGFYFCEFAEYLTRENVDAADILKLLYQSLRALSSQQIKKSLVKAVFELKIMAYNGEAPQVFECVKCKSTEKIPYFSFASGGLLCKSCEKNQKREEIQGMVLKDTTIYTMQYVLTASIEKLYTFALSDEILEEFKLCVENYVATYVDRKFKSLEMLKLI